MPTRRPRHLITETDSVASALDAAAERWPEHRNRRSRLLINLLEEGQKSLARQSDEAIAARRAAIKRSSGLLTGVYEPGYLQKLREEWPR